MPSIKDLRLKAWISVIVMSPHKDEYVTYTDSRLPYYGGDRDISYQLTYTECQHIANVFDIRLIPGIGGVHVQK